jgi:hypothetical protein
MILGSDLDIFIAGFDRNKYLRMAPKMSNLFFFMLSLLTILASFANVTIINPLPPGWL